MKNPRARTNLRGTSGGTGTLPSLIAFGSFVLIIACLYWAQAVLIPIALAIMLTFLLSPVAGALERIGLGRLPSVIIIVVLTFSLLATIGWVVTIEFTSLGNELPKYTGNIRQKISDVRGAGKGGALENVQKAIDEVKDEIQKKEEPVKVKEKPSGCREGRGVVHVLAHSFGLDSDVGAACRSRPRDCTGGLYAHSARRPAQPFDPSRGLWPVDVYH